MLSLANIEDVYDEVFPILLSICKDEEDAHSVIKVLLEGDARLLVSPTCFIVVTTEEDALLIWVAHSTAQDGIKRYLPELEHLALHSGHKSVRFRTERNGFEKMLKDGWKKVITWEKELVDGA